LSFLEKLSIIKIENSKEPESWRRAFWFLARKNLCKKKSKDNKEKKE